MSQFTKNRTRVFFRSSINIGEFRFFVRKITDIHKMKICRNKISLIFRNFVIRKSHGNTVFEISRFPQKLKTIYILFEYNCIIKYQNFLKNKKYFIIIRLDNK